MEKGTQYEKITKVRKAKIKGSRPSLEQSLEELQRAPPDQGTAKSPSEGSQVTDIPLQKQLQFERKGHACLRGLLPADELEALAGAIRAAAEEQLLESYRHRVAVLCPREDPQSVKSVAHAQQLLQGKGVEPVGFLQMFNLHRSSPAARQLAFSRRLAKAAADLLGARKVRLYQDCMFLKRPGFAATNWHSDLNMVPLDTNQFVTFWIPLQPIAPADSALLFASGSHRDFAMAYWQSNEGMAHLEDRNYALESYDTLALGDVTCHHGWTLHWAPPQPQGRPPRAAFTVSYFADGARVLSTKHARREPHTEDAWSFNEWRRELKEGQHARHALLPLVHPPPATAP
eukprot:jgi/Mesen1/5750/ME000292S04829